MFSVKTLESVVGQEIELTTAMIEKIELWDAMLKGQAPWCEESDYITSLGIEEGICREFADIVLNEMEVNISNTKLNDKFIYCTRNLNENLQSGLGLGSFILKPLGQDRAEFVTADRFIPVSFDSDKLIDCLFIQVKRKDANKYFFRLERHKIENNTLTITNKAYVSNSKTEIGREIELSTVDEWSSLPEMVSYPGMNKMDFGFYKNPIKNKVDESNCGVSIFESAKELIKKADTQGARLDWEFESGERAIHADEKALENSNSTPMVSKLNKRLYRGLNIQIGNSEELFKEYSPEFRDESIINGLEKYYRQIEFNVGLAYGDLSDAQSVDKTATEVRTSKARKYNRVTAIQSNLKDCLSDFLDGLAFYNGMLTSGYEFTCTFNDSILTDEEAERQQDRQDVSMGAMTLAEYRSKWYGETIEEAVKNIVSEPDEME